MSDKISFSLGGLAKPAAAGAAPSKPKSNLELLMAQAARQPSHAAKASSKPAAGAKKPVASLFADDDDDKRPSGRPDLLASKTSAPRPPTVLSRAERKQHAAALALDASVFDYDGVYDTLKASEAAAEAARKAEAAERKPKYIESFLQSAKTRELDRLRAEEKMLALEREKEGDEFDGKEKFVTEAYKRQMEEVRRAEEEEKKRDEELRKSKKGPGLTALYKSMLDDSEAKHAAAMAATMGVLGTPGPSLAIRRPPTNPVYDEAEEYDPTLAAEARNAEPSRPAPASGLRGANGAQGMGARGQGPVEINDDGDVVDKRTLLKAGLNITKKPAAPVGVAAGGGGAKLPDAPYVSRAVGSSATYAERMARERRRIAEQEREQADKLRLKREEEEREEEEKARRRREGDDGEAERKRREARERFLERKRKKEEEDEARKKAKTDE
ncbi:hypothetical protein Q5752_006613 [Cryptotrichosporon argae]